MQDLVISSGQALNAYLTSCSMNNITISEGGKLDYNLNEEDFETRDYSVLVGSETNIAEGTIYYQGEGPAQGQCVDGVFTGLSGTYRLGIGEGVSAIDPIIGTSETGKARLYVFSGGYVSGGVIGQSGDIDVFPNGYVEDVTIGGYVADSRFQTGICLYGGTAGNLMVSSNGYLTIYSDGQMTGSAIVKEGGSMHVYSGAIIQSADIQGGYIRVYGSATVNNLSVSTGNVSIYQSGNVGTATIESGNLSAYSSANITSISIGNDGVGKIYGSAIVSNAYINSASGAQIYGTATITTLNIDNAVVSIYNSAKITNANLLNNGILYTPTASSGLSITSMYIYNASGRTCK